ncbi:hypothetical protein [uncultured Bacteroides sp.]|uniref:hypothetical protein n=1 Tax=uncultured Bacteroides sp. TaxID=162156 RepID=UPI002AAAC183|nr:hypothetical protein [uncultured Bacteroides sp.]
MKNQKFNLSRIMKTAHRSYKRANGEKTFSECLVNSWKLAKLQLAVSGIDENVKKAIQKRNETLRNCVKATPSKAYNDLNIPESAYYNPNSTGLHGAHYVGD